MKKIICLCSVLLLISNVMGQGLIVTDQAVVDLPNQRIFPRPPRPIDPFLPIQIHQSNIDTVIKTQIATTTITQSLYNPCNRRVEGTFLFPVPKNAKINSFSMEIDGELTEGELLDASKARKIYEDIVRRTLDPALFEYCEQSLFKIRIFPFEPCSKKQIRIRYTQLLPKDENLVDYILPLKSREHCQGSDSKNVETFSLKVSIEASEHQRIKTVYSPSHDIEVTYNEQKTKANITLADKKEAPSTDFQLVYSSCPLDAGNKPLVTEFFTYYDGKAKDEGHFLLLVSPQIWNNKEDIKPQAKDVVFVFDSSGSMRGEKLEKAKEGLDFCLESLNRDDRFEIVRFSTDSEALFNGLVPATEDNLKKAAHFVEAVKAIGGTAVEEALSAAVEKLSATPNPEKRPRQIVFITDGKPTLGATNEKVLVEGVQSHLKDAGIKARVFSFGIGTEINTHLLDLLARETKGHAQFALPTEDIEHKISRFYSRFAEPVYSDLSLEIAGAEWVRDLTPKLMPDVFRGDQVVVLGRFKKSRAESELTLKGTFQGKTETLTFPISFAENRQQNQFIPRLWAVRRVGWLLEQIRLNGESDALKEEVTSLAREYAIVTPYTSWLILEDEARRDVTITNRSLRDIESAPMLRKGIQTRADAFAKEKSGAEAWASAASEAELKDARNTAAQGRAMDKSKYAEMSATSGVAVDSIRRHSVETQSRLINGKSFYLNSGQWVDSAAQALANTTPVKQLRFGTEDYFNFLTANPAACQWFSLGSNLRLALNETEIIEIIN